MTDTTPTSDFEAALADWSDRREAIQTNREKLSRLTPGSSITLEGGERILVFEHPAQLGSSVVHQTMVKIDEEFITLAAALPLLRQAVEAGAVVRLAGEED